MGHLDLPPVVVEPSIEAREGSETAQVLVDSSPMVARLERLDATRAVLRLATPEAEAAAGDGSAPPTTVVLLGALDETPVDRPGIVRREVVVDGWRIEVELESERRAALRDRARRGRTEAAQGGPTEVHAIIPGRVVSVSVQPGDAVVAAQQLLVVEAMKMQNELRAPREGTVTRVAVAAGENIEVGDLLLVLE
jgi:biotin carboxyl carrier protein